MLRGCAAEALAPNSGYLDFEMTLTAAPRATGPAAWADALLLSFAQAGYVQAEPAILQSCRAVSSIFRRGHPEKPLSHDRCQRRGTVPSPRPHHSSARDYLASSRAGQPAGFCYLGPVFRYRGGWPRASILRQESPSTSMPRCRPRSGLDRGSIRTEMRHA